jgi:2-dehydro-3-deoxy-D-gluconate 5-dehydrogenase
MTEGGDPTMFDLTGRVALVTGGNGGIGLGMAKGLAGAGARVVVAARNAEKSDAAVRELKALGCDAFTIPVDVADERSVESLFAQVADRCGRLDVLINNAGINIRKPAHELALDEWRQVMETNLTSAFLCSRSAYPQMKRTGAGKIVNVGSMLSIFGASFAPAYGASKGGVMQLTKSLAVGWAPDNIQVNAVLPGWIDTDLTRTARAQVQGLNERVLARSPTGRWGTGADFEGIAAFLASRASDFVTGTAIPVDGGYSAQV